MGYQTSANLFGKRGEPLEGTQPSLHVPDPQSKRAAEECSHQRRNRIAMNDEYGMRALNGRYRVPQLHVGTEQGSHEPAQHAEGALAHRTLVKKDIDRVTQM